MARRLLVLITAWLSPSPPVRFNMLFSGSRERREPILLTDPRVTHYRDPDQVIGRWLDEHEQSIGFDLDRTPVVWDS